MCLINFIFGWFYSRCDLNRNVWELCVKYGSAFKINFRVVIIFSCHWSSRFIASKCGISFVQLFMAKMFPRPTSLVVSLVEFETPSKCYTKITRPSTRPMRSQFSKLPLLDKCDSQTLIDILYWWPGLTPCRFIFEVRIGHVSVIDI